MSKEKKEKITEQEVTELEPKERTVKETLVSGAEYWDFETNSVFEGKYVGQHVAENDSQKMVKGEPSYKKGDTLGYFFEDDQGEEHIVQNSYNIQKAISHKKVDIGSELRFTYKGKGENSNGQPVNKFKIQLL